MTNTITDLFSPLIFQTRVPKLIFSPVFTLGFETEPPHQQLIYYGMARDFFLVNLSLRDNLPLQSIWLER